MTESPSDSLLCDAEQDRMQRLNALRNPLTDPVKRRIAAEGIASELKFIEIDLQKAAMFGELVELVSIAHPFVMRSYERHIGLKEKASSKGRDSWVEMHAGFAADRKTIIDRMETALDSAKELLR